MDGETERERERVDISKRALLNEKRISCCNSCKKFLVKILYRQGKKFE